MTPRHEPLIALATLVALTSCTNETSPAEIIVEPPPVLWSTLAPAASTAPAYPGVVAAAVQTELGFQLTGRLTSRSVSVGDSVARSEILATIDDTSLASSITGAQGELKDAETRLQSANRDAARIDELVRVDAATAADRDTAVYDQKAAEALLDLARANLSRARERQRNTRMEAPYRGIILDVAVDIGDVVDAGQPVITIADPDDLEVSVDIPPDRIHSISTDMPAEIVPELFPQSLVKGKVVRIAPVADAESQAFRVTVSITSPAEDIRLGSTVIVRFPVSREPQVSIPARAIFRRDDTTFLWLLDRSTTPVVAHAVVIAIPKNGQMPAEGDIQPGAAVVVAGVGSLEEGQAVRLAEEVPHE